MEDNSNPYQFTCFWCGGQVIEEIMVKVVVAILIIHHDGEVDYEEQTNEEGVEVGRYQCKGCGAVLKENGNRITDRKQMVEWIKSRRD